MNKILIDGVTINIDGWMSVVRKGKVGWMGR